MIFVCAPLDPEEYFDQVLKSLIDAASVLSGAPLIDDVSPIS
jgi:hypothetical protein